MDRHARIRAAVAGGSIAMGIAIALSGCSSTQSMVTPDDGTDAGTSGPNYSRDGGVSSGDGGVEQPPTPDSFSVTLVPEGVTGAQRVNFAVPLSSGKLADAAAI